MKNKITKLKATAHSITPIIFHSSEGADPDSDIRPLDPLFSFIKKDFPKAETFGEALGSLKSKMRKTPEDKRKLAKLGFFSSGYWNSKGQLIVPADNIMAMIVAQGAPNRLGPKIKRGVLVPEDSLLEFKDMKAKPAKLYPKYSYLTIVNVMGKKTPRVRIMIDKWKFSFTMEIVEDEISVNEVKDILRLGDRYGSFERRPRFGRYKVSFGK